MQTALQNLCFYWRNLKTTQNCLANWVYHSAFLPAVYESSCCSSSASAFVISVPDFGFCTRCVVAAQCCFNLRFPDGVWSGASFHLLICHLYIFFSELAAKIFMPFLDSSLYILNSSPYQACVYKSFFPFCGLFSDSLLLPFHSRSFPF